MAPSSSPPCLVPERDFAKKIGVPRGVLRMMRHRGELTEEADFVRLEGTVQLLDAGVKKVRAHLGLPAGNGDQEPPPERVTLIVDRPAPGNPKIVLCHTERGAKVRLRVRHNINFVPGMRVSNCVQEHADLFCFEGRLPRWRGKY